MVDVRLRSDDAGVCVQVGADETVTACVDHHVEAFVPQVMQSASDSLQSTLDNEDQNDPMVEAKNRGKEAALKFKMGGCCKICETRFYRDLAFLEVSESYSVRSKENLKGTL